MQARYANAQGTDVLLETEDGVFAVKPGDPRLAEMTILPYEAPPPPVPQEVTNFQARAVLMTMPGFSGTRTMFDEVNDLLQAQGGTAWQAWEYANTVTRTGALVQAMASQLGLTEQQLDEMFIAAAQIAA